MRRKQVLLIWSGRPEDTSHKLFLALSSCLEGHCDVSMAANSVSKASIFWKAIRNALENLRRFGQIRRSDAVVIHSYASLSLLSVIAARAMRKKVIIFSWDIYPTTLKGHRRKGLARRLADGLEGITISMATTVIVPSPDFLSYVCHKNLLVMPLWPSLNAQPRIQKDKQIKIRIAFVGQLDITRGVENFVEWIQRSSRTPVELHIFAGTQRLKNADESNNVRIVYHPRMDRDVLQERIVDMDLGLVSLHPQLDQPGFPSKVFDYVAANLPVIYFGRPLPAFCNLLETSGIGTVARGDTIDLQLIHEQLMSNWPQARELFLERTAFDAPVFLAEV